MSNAIYAIPHFLGGEISAFAQGRFDKPDYRVSLNVCLNALPTEIGTWTRRPGTAFAGTTRGGAPGRVIKFDFEQATPYTAEFTDGFLRWRNGTALATTNDPQVILAISAANPAVVQTTSATTWATGNTLIFPGLSTPLLQNRQFLATKIDTTHFSLADAITGANIDGATLGALTAGATVARVQELVTVYSAGSWSSIRAVQAETTDILLSPTLAPQALTVPTLPSIGASAVFAIGQAVFNDGPYLDPFINGVQATPSAKSGIIAITLSFPAWSATTAYAVGTFVTQTGTNYISLVDQNVNQSPATNPSFWAQTPAGTAVGPNGFQGTDIGRMIRLFSEPPLWLVGSSYIVGNIVTYNPSGAPGASTYWQSLTANSGKPPGSDITNWQLVPQGAAIWTWGKIVALSNILDRALAGSVNIGDMTQGGGTNAAFDGVFSKPFASGANKSVSGSPGPFPQGSAVGFGGSYVGKNYTAATDQKIQQATIYPSSDSGLVFGTYRETFSGNTVPFQNIQIALSLRGKASAPASPSDGTLLGTTGIIGNSLQAITIISTDQVTAWKYVWIEVEASATFGANANLYTIVGSIAQVSYFGPPGTGTTGGVNIEILGPPLLYTNPVLTWRLGAFSDTTGWPTCGTYAEGRLWLAGAIPNRFDACVSNGILGGTVNFAPTDQYGVVAASAAISQTLNSDGVNPIFWMDPDLQGIRVGTQAGEWLIQAPTTGPISPTNIAARRVTKIGCANIEPRRTENTTVFVQRFAQKLMEGFADVYSGKFSAPNIADKAQHITKAGISELAYQQAVTPVIWGRDTLGALFGITYKRDTLTTSQGPTYAAWHRHALGSSRVIESICVGPSTGGDLDSLTMVTNDPATGIRHVEIVTDTMDELSTLASAWFLDDAITPTGNVLSDTPVLPGAPYGGITLNGLWHLNGKTVTVFAGGLDCGDFAVANGACFVPYGDTISAGTGGGLFTAAFAATAAIVVGFTYNSDGQLVRMIAPADTGARNGPAFGSLSRMHRYILKLVNTAGLSVGTTFTKMRPANFKQPNNAAMTPLTTFTGICQDTLEDDETYDRGLCWRVSRPFPVNVVAAGANVATQDQ